MPQENLTTWVFALTQSQLTRELTSYSLPTAGANHERRCRLLKHLQRLPGVDMSQGTSGGYLQPPPATPIEGPSPDPAPSAPDSELYRAHLEGANASHASAMTTSRPSDRVSPGPTQIHGIPTPAIEREEHVARPPVPNRDYRHVRFDEASREVRTSSPYTTEDPPPVDPRWFGAFPYYQVANHGDQQFRRLGEPAVDYSAYPWVSYPIGPNFHPNAGRNDSVGVPSAQDDRGFPPPGPIPRERASTTREFSSGRYERTAAGAAYDIMRRWNLHFSGRSGEDCLAFIARIDEGRVLVPIEDRDLLHCLPFFLQGIALYWFRSRRHEWHTWSSFVRAFQIRFGDADFQYTLRNELAQRTQGEQEPVADFLTCIRAMAERLSPPMSNFELISLAHRNLLPKLQVTIHRAAVATLEQLEALATRVERSYALVHSFRPPPPPERCLLPDLAYHGHRVKQSRATVATLTSELEESHLNSAGEALPEAECLALRETANRSVPTSNNHSRSPVASTPATNSPTTPPPSSNRPATSAPCCKCPCRNTNPFLTDTSPVAEKPTPANAANRRCWNCDELGHGFRSCSSPRIIFCYGCGAKDQTRNTCPKCSGNRAGGQ